MLRYTRGFRDNINLLKHHQKHCVEFGSISVDDYETMADIFLGGPIGNDTLECRRRSDRAVVRYNQRTNDFGILTHDNIIKSYFKPIRGINYFRENCAK